MEGPALGTEDNQESTMNIEALRGHSGIDVMPEVTELTKSCTCPTGDFETSETTHRRCLTVKCKTDDQSPTSDNSRRSRKVQERMYGDMTSSSASTNTHEIFHSINFNNNNKIQLHECLCESMRLQNQSVTTDSITTFNSSDTSIEIISTEDNQEYLRTNLPVQNLPYITVNLGYVENDNELTADDTGNKEQTATPSPPPEYKSLVNLFLIDAPPKYQDVVPPKSKSDAVTVKIIGKANGETVEVRCDRKALTSWCFILSIIAVLAILSILFVVYNI